MDTHTHNHKNKQKILIGLKKAHTLLGKVVDMTEKDKYCIDIMQQNLAVIGLLRSAHEALMENHLQSCFADAMATKDKKKKAKMTAEILKVSRFNK